MKRVNRRRLLNAPKHARNWGVALRAGLLFYCGSAVMGADPLETWHRRTPPVSATSEDFAGVAYVTLPDQNGLTRFYRIMKPGK